MAKRGSMDIYMKQRQSVSDLDDSDSNESDARSTEVLTAKRSRSTFVRKYDPSYLKFGFVGADEAGVQKPQCVACGAVLSTDSIKPSDLKRYLHSKHKDYSSKPKEFFERKRSE